MELPKLIQRQAQGHVHKVYTGDVPSSMHVDWLEKEAKLKSLILKAYRCNVKCECSNQVYRSICVIR